MAEEIAASVVVVIVGVPPTRLRVLVAIVHGLPAAPLSENTKFPMSRLVLFSVTVVAAVMSLENVAVELGPSATVPPDQFSPSLQFPEVSADQVPSAAEASGDKRVDTARKTEAGFCFIWRVSVMERLEDKSPATLVRSCSDNRQETCGRDVVVSPRRVQGTIAPPAHSLHRLRRGARH